MCGRHIILLLIYTADTVRYINQRECLHINATLGMFISTSQYFPCIDLCEDHNLINIMCRKRYQRGTSCWRIIQNVFKVLYSFLLTFHFALANKAKTFRIIKHSQVMLAVSDDLCCFSSKSGQKQRSNEKSSRVKAVTWPT